MYLHLGEGIVVPYDRVIGIFDLDNTTVSKDTRDFLRNAQGKGEVINIGSEVPKSFVVCFDGERETLYTSQISSSTLLKRARQITDYETMTEARQ